jgi:hypothetical protein
VDYKRPSPIESGFGKVLVFGLGQENILADLYPQEIEEHPFASFEPIMSNRDAVPLIEDTAQIMEANMADENRTGGICLRLRGRRSLVYAAVQASLPHGLCDALAIELVFHRSLSSALRCASSTQK